MKNIACILINYNQDELTLDCIRSVNQGIVVPDIIVVDNGSEKIDKEAYAAIENVRLIENQVNSGFAGGNNIGIKVALKDDYEYILLLNNDTVVDARMVEKLLEYANNNTITTAKMYYYNEPDKLWFAGGYIDYQKALACHTGKDETDHGQYEQLKIITFVTGCCMMINRRIIETTGLLDEDLFLYCEDMDFCLRAGQQGIRMLYVPEAKLWHKVGSSSGGDYSPAAVYYCTRNRFAMLKNYPFSLRAKAYTYSTRMMRWLASLAKQGSDRMIWQAYWDYKKGRMGKYD